MNRKEVKQKIADNKEEIVSWLWIGGAAACYIGLIVYATKKQNAHNAQVAANRQKLIDAINARKTILPNTDGSFWILDIPA